MFPGVTQAELYPDFWVKVNASVSSIRTGEGKLISTDALTLDKDRLAFITYWEVVRSPTRSDIFRCVDVQTNEFAQIEHTCWKSLNP
jgi:hypothetical protein